MVVLAPKSSCCFQFDRKQHLSSPGSHCVPYVPSCPGGELSLPSNVDMDEMGGVFWVMGSKNHLTLGNTSTVGGGVRPFLLG